MDESRSESLTRRRFLASLGTAVGGVVAGCPGQRGGSVDDVPVTTPAPVPTPDRSAHPVPSLDGVGCPGVPKLQGDVSRICGPPSGTDSGFGIVTNPTEDDPGIPSLPRASFTFRFFRDQQTTLSGLKPPWSLQKYVDGRWHTVRPATIRTEDGFLATGGRSQRTWRLTVDNDATARLDPRADTGGARLNGSVTRVPVAGLGGGVYAFVVAGWADGEEAGRPIAVGARFRLRGPPLALSHTEAVERVAHSGDTVTAVADPGLGDPVTYVLSRTRRAADTRQLLPEEAVTNPRFATSSPRTTRSSKKSSSTPAGTRRIRTPFSARSRCATPGSRYVPGVRRPPASENHTRRYAVSSAIASPVSSPFRTAAWRRGSSATQSPAK